MRNGTLDGFQLGLMVLCGDSLRRVALRMMLAGWRPSLPEAEEQLARVRSEVESLNKRAEKAEARVRKLEMMLNTLPEHIRREL